ncbi:MAG: flagellar export chaperone FliS [Burkholderiales bacterium]
MSVSVARAVAAYARMEVETGIESARPEQLIVMLYDGALKSIYKAKADMLRNDPAAKGAAISKAITIIEDGLRGALDLKAGDIAANLDSLYEYMSNKLLVANLKNDQAALDEVAKLLGELKGAWEKLAQDQVAAVNSGQGG